MFKWVVGLCATIYMTLLIFGAPPEGEQTAALGTQLTVTATDAVIVEDIDTDEVAETEAQSEPLPKTEDVQAEIVPVAQIATELTPTPIVSAVLESDASVEEPAAPQTVNLSIAAPAAEVASAPTQTPFASEPNLGVGEIWTVTGSRVNLRSGPTTNASVLGQAVRGDGAEVMELLDNGWAKVYILESGVEAYMSADFISRDG